MGRWVAMLWVGLAAGSAVAQTSVNNTGDIFFSGDHRTEVVAQNPAKDMLGPQFYTGHPYSMTETVTTTGARGSIVRVDRYFRDTQGRECTESATHLRDGVETFRDVTIQDPIAQLTARLMPQDKVVRMSHWTQPQSTAIDRQVTLRLQTKAKADRAAGKGGMQIEELGTKMVAGVAADGLRTTFVVPAGQEGNADEIRMVTETWIAQDLKIVVGRTQDDGRGKKTSWVVSELKMENPDHTLFEIPGDFHTVDQKTGPDVKP